MAQLYLSYPNDDRAVARELEVHLVELGHQVSVFHETMVPGDPLTRSMYSRLAAADGLVVVVTRAAVEPGSARMTSSWMASEIGAARAARGKVVIPLIIDEPDQPAVAIPELVDDLYAVRFDRRDLVGAARAVDGAMRVHLARRRQQELLALPPGYEHLAPNVLRLNEDTPFERGVFVMMKFPDRDMDAAHRNLLDGIWRTIQEQLAEHGLQALRADQRAYHDQLWENVCVYMLGCRFGIAVLEDRVADELNPNLALEYGFMKALGRQATLLRDASFKHHRADLTGKLAREFVIGADLTLDRPTLQVALRGWLEDVGLRREAPPPAAPTGG